ncbi:MAG: hypothetical protein FD141_1043 [Fusobacteria bacterium]|nr:MAG: hypothetical protein FD141_1043 [Fusobacteriota bacterium]KAF0229756.1 MAG: hypothetical protein FD182_146 [Fusobacteriota bacterium]
MLVLFFTLILLIMMIVLSQLNPGVITVNFFGLLVKNIPISLFMLLFIIIGIIWTISIFGIKYFNLRKQHKELIDSLCEKRTED